MQPVIYARPTLDNEYEFSVAGEFFPVSTTRVGLANKLVIARYSALPFYEELEADLALQGSRLLNTYEQHRYIANFDWYRDTQAFTPRTWFELSEVPEGGPYVVKGRTNSRKFEWNTRMFAPTRESAVCIGADLMADDLISHQGIVVREFVKLRTYETGLNGLPFTNEWRFFFLGERMLSYGYYWSIAETVGEMDGEGMLLAQRVAKIIAKRVPFFVLDLAQTESGEWILIEVNDAQMAGLSLNSPGNLYGNLKACLK